VVEVMQSREKPAGWGEQGTCPYIGQSGRQEEKLLNLGGKKGDVGCSAGLVSEGKTRLNGENARRTKMGDLELVAEV